MVVVKGLMQSHPTHNMCHLLSQWRSAFRSLVPPAIQLKHKHDDFEEFGSLACEQNGSGKLKMIMFPFGKLILISLISILSPF